MKLIDADKLLKWLNEKDKEWYGRYGEYGDGHVKAFATVEDAIKSGTFDPTLPVQPDTGEVIKDED